MLFSRLGSRANAGEADDVFQLTFMIIKALLPWKKFTGMLPLKTFGEKTDV